MKIYDNEPIKSALKRAGLPEGNYIHINLTETPTAKRSKREGLDIASVVDDTYRKFPTSEKPPIILYSFESPFTLFLDRKFMSIMSNEYAHFLRLPFILKEISYYLVLPTFRNEALEIAAKQEEKIDLLKEIRHDYGHDKEKGISRARNELRFSGSDKEIVSLLQNPDKNLPRCLEWIPGVFCDIEGTLFKNKKINQEVLEQLFDYSKDYPVTLWTGGNVKQIVKGISTDLEIAIKEYANSKGIKTNLHLRTPMLSKHIFAGSQPQIVIDDLTIDEFQKQFGMKPDAYIQVK